MEQYASIGKYDLEEFLGGGMSHVYRAKDRVLGRTVCVKVLTPQGTADPEVRERFLQEARMAGNFCHDNVVSIYDFGEDNGKPFLVMEYLRGDTLRTLMNEHRVGGLREVLQIGLQLARALECVHAQRIIHRDVKPENVHVNTQGSVKLMDFGIAKADGLSMTQAGFILGTPYYMAPEQILGEQITAVIDVYAFGVLLYELLAGQKPYKAESAEAIFYAILNQPADPAPLQQANVPEAVKQLIGRCMSKKAEDRPQTFGEVGAVIEKLLTAQSLATTIDPRPSLAEPGKSAQSERTPDAIVSPAPPPAGKGQSTLKWWLAAVLAVAAAGGAVFFVVRSRPVPSATPSVATTGAAGSRPAALPATVSDPAGDMVLVSAGEFPFGEKGEKLTLPAFYIDKTEVSNAAYASFCKQTGCTAPTAAADLPVVNVSLDDARKFAAWAGKSVPTDHEWEKAARSDEGRKYPWGNASDGALANIGAKAVVPVGEFPQSASKCGAIQMAGNVWEMIDSLQLPSAAAVGRFKMLKPPATATEPWIQIRGGAFNSDLATAVTWEFATVPARFKAATLGFRCVRNVR